MRQPNRQLADMLQELISDERLYHGRPAYGTKVLKAIFQTIKDALHRGEAVHIRGFGTFKVINRQPFSTPNNILANGPDHRPIAYAKGVRHPKPRPAVVFKPSMPLMAMLNMPSTGAEPNYKERRAQARWSVNAD